MKKLLVCGGLPNEKYHCRYGGATVLMKNFYDYLYSHHINFRFVQTNKYINTRTFELKRNKNKVYFILNFLRNIFWCDVVMFNFSDHATVEMFPFLSVISKRLHKKIVLRKFGGSFDSYLNGLAVKKVKQTIQALNRTDFIFLETKASINHVQSLITDKEKVQWFPNVRKRPPIEKNTMSFSHRLVFMSHVSTEKGVLDLLEAFSKLPRDYELDIYGAIKEKCFNNFDWHSYHVCYKGQIPAETIIEKLSSYSLLLLPSYREGYPGIIIEALSVGMPVVATEIGGIPEIVTDGYNGRLIKPGDIDGLVKAVLSVTAENYEFYSANAKMSFEANFESEKTNDRILELLLS